MSTEGTLTYPEPPKATPWQVIAMTIVLVLGLAAGLVAGRITAPKTAVGRSESPVFMSALTSSDAARIHREVVRAMNRLGSLRDRVPICAPCLAREQAELGR